MSGKNIFAAVALMLFGAAVFVFYNRGDTKIIVQELKDQPKIKLMNYEYYRVKEDVETARMIGKRAELMDGGLVFLREGFRGVRIRDGRQEEVSANSADIELSTTSPGQLSEETQAKKARMFENVIANMGNARIESEEVHYSQEDSMMQSDRPVKISQNTQIIHGKGGFNYSLSKETIKMFGGVNGTLIPKELSQAQKKGKSP